MSTPRRTVAPLAALALAPLALIACTSNNAQTGAPVEPDSQVLAQQNSDPFSQPRRDAVFAHPVTLFVSNPMPLLGMYGDLPNTGAVSQPAARSPQDNGNISQITHAIEGADFDPAPSPDGTRIFFASTRHRATSDIYAQNVDGAAVTQLTSDPAHDVMPAVSPDNSRVAFASNRNGSWDIYVMSVNGGQAVQVTSESSQELHPTWSPDGQAIAYCRLSEAYDRWEIWVTDLSKPSAHTFLTYGLFPEWHPTKDRILFQRSRDRGDRLFSLWTIDYTDGEASAPTEVASSAEAAVINPTWSPDGSYIACSTVAFPGMTEPGRTPPLADIWILSEDASTRTNLTAGWRFNSMPAWGPDGRIFFVSDRSGVPAIWSAKAGQAVDVARAMRPTPAPPQGAEIAAAEDESED